MNREILQNAIGKYRKLTTHRDNDIKTVAKWIYSWKWKFTASNAFRVNHGVLPGIAGTVLTYFVILFQLELSENNRN
ncbi:unnamed protein product [Allacma fusca]|uniref:Uncharacterized protein n=1 Tax=Allacma fusca TaxID=39272 RepID=A0A8J2JV48_9HEXA|nr:unnamed protein product [Allacma fusca]